MTARNDITGDAIASRTTIDKYRENFDRIFTKEKLAQRELKTCDVCGKPSGDKYHIHTCTPPAVLKAQQRLTDLLQIEPGYTGGCTHDCNQGRNCRCGRS